MSRWTDHVRQAMLVGIAESGARDIAEVENREGPQTLASTVAMKEIKSFMRIL